MKAWAVNIKCDESNVTTRIFAMEPQAVSTAGSPKALTAALADLQAGVRYLVQCRYVSIAADDIIVSMVFNGDAFILAYTIRVVGVGGVSQWQ